MSAKNKEFTLRQMGNDMFEVRGKLNGLAKMNDSGEWEISPNLEKYEDAIRKLIHEFAAKEGEND